MNESLKRLRWLILNNFTELEGWHIVLTYAKKMLEFDNAAKDFKKFYDNLKYHYKQYKFEYIRIIEPQESGSWHIHLLLKSVETKEQVRFSNSDIQKLWGHGSAKIKQIYDVKGLALYFTAANHENNKDKKGFLSKGHKKPSRWRFYPSGAKLYTKSKGIKPPKEIRATHREIEKLLDGYDRSGGCSLLITEKETGSVLNQIDHEYFTKK